MKTRQELQAMCLRGWEQCEANELLNTATMTAADVEDNAYEILALCGDVGDVDELTDEEFEECVEILKTLRYGNVYKND